MLNQQETLYTVGGTVQAGSGIYISRQADQDMLSHCQKGDFAYVLAARQLGKSSLMVRTANQLAQQGIGTAVVDLTELGVQASAEEWYLGLMFKIATQLSPQTDMLNWWNTHAHIGFTQRLVLFFEEIILANNENEFVIFIDEIDSTLSLEFTDDFFAAIRYTYNARATESLFQRLSFVLIGVAMPSDLINDPKRTPFNIGERVELSDFTIQEVLPLSKGLAENPDKAQQILNRVWHWTQGHPYLTQRLCKIIATESQPNLAKPEIDHVVKKAFFGNMSREDSNLLFVHDMLTRRAPNREDVLKTYSNIRLGWQAVRNEEQSITKNHLKLSGIVRREQDNLRVRNPIYAQVFNRRWLKENRPHNWWQELPIVIKVASFVIIILLIALLVATNIAIQRATIANERADLAHSRLLISQSESLLDSQYDLALLLGLEANHLINNTETSTYLDYALNYNPYLLTYLRAHEKPVKSMVFTPDGRFLASASKDGTIIVWDLQSNKPAMPPLLAHANIVESLAVTSDGKLLTSGGCKQFAGASDKCLQGELIIWDMRQTPQIIKELRTPDNIWSLDFNTDDTLLASSGISSLIIWNTQTWQPIWQLTNEINTFTGVDFHPQYKNIMSVGTNDGHIKILDTNTGEFIQDLQAHQDVVYTTSFSPDGQLLAATSKDGAISLWRTNTWESLPLLTEHTDQVVNAQFSPDGRLLVSNGLDGKTIIWDIEQEIKPIQELSGHQGDAHFITFHPNPDKNIIATNGPNHSIILWDINGDTTRQTSLPTQSHPILGLSFAPNGNTLAATGSDGAVDLWDIPTQQQIESPLVGHTDLVRRLAFDPTGQYLATGGKDQNILLWNMKDTSITPVQLHGHERTIRSVKFHPDGNIFASSGDDSKIIVWDPHTSQQIGELSNGSRELFDLAFSPDGQLLAAGSWDGTVQFWSTQTWQTIGEPIPIGFEQIWAIAFSPNGESLAVAGNSEKVIFIDVTNYELLPELLTGHINRINTLAFTPDGSTLVTGGADNQIMFWQMPSQKQIASPLSMHNDEVFALAFSPDGHVLASGDLSGNIVFTIIQHEAVKNRACQIINRSLTFSEWSQYIGENYSYHKICQESP